MEVLTSFDLIACLIALLLTTFNPSDKVSCIFVVRFSFVTVFNVSPRFDVGKAVDEVLVDVAVLDAAGIDVSLPEATGVAVLDDVAKGIDVSVPVEDGDAVPDGIVVSVPGGADDAVPDDVPEGDDDVVALAGMVSVSDSAIGT
jgi:hypothetical protein